MNIALSRFLAALWAPNTPMSRRYSRLNLTSLSDHDLADLNLPPDVQASADLARRKQAIRGW